MEPFAPVGELVERARAFGFRETKSGAKLYGHVPHIAPEAWLHQLYAPLPESQVNAIEERVGNRFPAEFREFLQKTNGLNLFSCSLAIYGKRSSYGRSGDEVWQPFCIITANTLDRPWQAKAWQIIVGSYRSDGSLISLDARDGSAFKTKRSGAKPLNRWPGFWAMLTEEALNLSTLFDESGHKQSERPTPPTR